MDKIEPRECGGCTQCCKTMAVTELKKPRDIWCANCAIGKGCIIYEERPDGCRKFDCLWVLGNWPEELRPNRTRVVPSLTNDGKNILLHVDPGYENNLSHGRFGTMIQNVRRTACVFVICGSRRYILPDWSGRDYERIVANLEAEEAT